MTYGEATRTIRKLLKIIDRRADLSNVERRFVRGVRKSLPGKRGRPRVKYATGEIRRAVKEYGSRAEAARKLGISVSTIDRRLKNP